MIDIKRAKFGNSPFKYWIIDDAIDSVWAQEIHNNLLSFEERSLEKCYRYNNHFEDKYAFDKWSEMNDQIWIFFTESMEPKFISKLEELTGISGLIPDPYLRGAGIHLHGPGGKLDIHKDFTRHEKLGLIRRLNVLLYMNQAYQPHYGGHLELWEKDMSKKAIQISPIYNRMVVFETPDAPHGLGTPWNGTDCRKSLSLYYYTAPTPADFEKEHLSTQFLKKPNEETTEEIEALREKRNKGRLSSNIL